MSQTNQFDTTLVTNALSSLQNVIPSQIEGKTASEASVAVVSCLLGPLIQSDTNIPQLVSSLQSNTYLESFVSDIKSINLTTLQNLTNPQNLFALVNLLVAIIMGLSALKMSVQNLNINLNKTTIYNASFLVLVSLLLVALIENTNFLIDIQNSTNVTILFDFLKFLESAYNSLVTSSYLLQEIGSFLNQIGYDVVERADTCCKCVWNPFKKSTTNVSLNQAEIVQKVGLRKSTFLYAVELANLKK